MRSVLVAGGGIAGPALAYWLARRGIEVTVVERDAAPGERGGQGVDVRGAGRDVIRWMGLEDRVRAAGTGERGIRFVDAAGRTRARLGVDLLAGTGGEGLTAELEILRGELARILHEATPDTVRHVFGDRVSGVEDTGDRVRVRLAGGAEHEADVLVGADGIGSVTRRLVLGDADGAGRPFIRPRQLSVAYLTIARTAEDTDWARVQHLPGGRLVALRPDNVGTTRALLGFLSRPCLRELDPGAQRAVLRERFAGAGGLAQRVLAALEDTAEFYAEDVAQVKLPAFSRGRTVLLGDAAYCASPISGMGTSLSLAGAYVLAHELGAYEQHTDAFAGYQRRMAPYVREAQKLAPGAPRLAVPRSRAGIRALHTGLRVVASRPLTAVLARLVSPPADAITLPAPFTR